MFDRARGYVRSLNWSKVVGEILIIVIGVFLGVQASNWNQARIERQDTLRLLRQLRPELRFQLDEHARLPIYYRTTGAYSDIALAGWRRDPAVSDRQFVIAAYQASQITGLTYDATNWGNIFGSNQIQNIRDENLRTRLIRMLTINNSLTDWHSLQTDYRFDVRHLILPDVQQAIRANCGERLREGSFTAPTLPPRCDTMVAPAEVKATAEVLRRNPKLVNELAWHRAQVATFLQNNEEFMATVRSLADAIPGVRRGGE